MSLIHEQLTEKIIGAAIEVHRELGPGVLESIYESCLCQEFELQKIEYKRQLTVPVIYKGVTLSGDYRIDLTVEDKIVVEIKVVDNLLPVHEAQLLTYLHLTGLKVGLLINFHVAVLRNGIRRMVL